MLTDDPSSYVPPEVETEPPVPAETVKLYWVTDVEADELPYSDDGGLYEFDEPE